MKSIFLLLLGETLCGCAVVLGRTIQENVLLPVFSSTVRNDTNPSSNNKIRFG